MTFLLSRLSRQALPNYNKYPHVHNSKYFIIISCSPQSKSLSVFWPHDKDGKKRKQETPGALEPGPLDSDQVLAKWGVVLTFLVAQLKDQLLGAKWNV